MRTNTYVKQTEINTVKPDTKSHIGESTAVYVEGIGDVIIVGNNKQIVKEIFAKLVGSSIRFSESKMHRVAVIQEENITHSDPDSPTLLMAARMALEEIISLQSLYNDAMGIGQSSNGIAIFLEEAITAAEEGLS